MSDATPKIRTICVDTLTGIQSELYMLDKKKANHDKWKDYGQDIWRLISWLQDKGFEIVLILGEPGTGKSSGMRTLHSKTNIWLNADNKNPVWTGGKAEYGKKFNPILPYHTIPKSYQDIREHVEEVEARGMFEEEKFAILTGHIEDYKSGVQTKMRLKTLGNMATNMQIEGKLETVLYSNVVKESGETKYVLETENSGLNTARSPMGAFEGIIENDYQAVIDQLMAT
tara:strand:+ start:1702 stop:2385 length:684 start_codon:yes stop_codon:yes gene_type:complete